MHDLKTSSGIRYVILSANELKPLSPAAAAAIREPRPSGFVGLVTEIEDNLDVFDCFDGIDRSPAGIIRAWTLRARVFLAVENTVWIASDLANSRGSTVYEFAGAEDILIFYNSGRSSTEDVQEFRRIVRGHRPSSLGAFEY